MSKKSAAALPASVVSARDAGRVRCTSTLRGSPTPNSKADAATPAPHAGVPGAETKDRARADRRASADAPPKGITITGRSLAPALGILGSIFMLQWDRTGAVEAQVRDLSVELHTEINGLRW